MRRSGILLAGHRREKGRYELLSFGFLFGFRIRTMMALFHMAGMVAVLTELLKIFPHCIEGFSEGRHVYCKAHSFIVSRNVAREDACTAMLIPTLYRG